MLDALGTPLLVGGAALAAAATAISFAVLLLRARSRAALAEHELAELRTVAADLQRMQKDEKFARLFLREFSQLSLELHQTNQIRAVPVVLTNMLQRIFQPREALVLVRRRATLAHPERERQLIVAACGPMSDDRVGKVIDFGEGELGFVAEARLVMDRDDLSRSRRSRAGGALTGFRTDLAAPMEIDGSVLGVLAVSEPSRLRAYGKEILRLIAQSGAAKLKSSRAINQIRAVADTDALTGIFNKRVLTYRLGELVFEAEQNREQVAVFIFDVDHFKNYNDVNGHVAGDHLLRELVALVEERVRGDDVFGRFGGEEFLIILPGRGTDDALHLAEDIRAAIESHRFPHGENQPLGHLTVSGGVAAFPDHADNSVQLLRHADAALYRAKADGRNRIRVAGSGMAAAAPEPRAEPRPRVAEEAAVAAAPAPQQTNGDNLRAIRGIGLNFERALKRSGISTYRQIARFHHFGLQGVASLLRIAPDRIERDDWVGQAKTLHFEKYGERL